MVRQRHPGFECSTVARQLKLLLKSFQAVHQPVQAPLARPWPLQVATVLRDPSSVSGGSAPMYGMANAVPDRGMIAEFLTAYQDVMLEP